MQFLAMIQARVIRLFPTGDATKNNDGNYDGNTKLRTTKPRPTTTCKLFSFLLRKLLSTNYELLVY